MAAVKNTLFAFIFIAAALSLCHVVDGAATPPSPDETYDGDNGVGDSGPVDADGPPAPPYPQPPEPSHYTRDNVNDGKSDVKEPAYYDNANVESDRPNMHNRERTVDDGNTDVKEPPHYDNANVESDRPNMHNRERTVDDGNTDVKEPPHYDNANVESDRPNMHNRERTVDDGNNDVKEPPHYDNANIEYDSPNVKNPDDTVNDGKNDVNEPAHYDNNVEYDSPNVRNPDGPMNVGKSDVNEPAQYDNADVQKTDGNVNNGNSDGNEPSQYDNTNVESDSPRVDYTEDSNAVTDANASNAAGDDVAGDTNVGVYSSQSSSSNSEGGTPVNNKKCSFSLVQKSKFDPTVDKLNKTILDRMNAAFKNSPLAIQIFGKYLDPGSAGKSASFASPQSGIPPIGSNPGISPINANPGLGLDSPLGRSGSTRPRARTIKANPNHNAFNVNQMFNQISGDATGFSHPISKFKGISSNPTGNFGLKPAFIGGGGHRHGGGIHGDFFSNFGNFFRRRRKRMAVPPSPEVFNGARKPKAVCPPNRNLVTGFLKSGNPCYVYRADVQGIETDACQHKECNACADSGPAQCMPEDLSSWVWAWCPTQAPGDLLTYEYLEYPAYCSCKAIQC